MSILAVAKAKILAVAAAVFGLIPAPITMDHPDHSKRQAPKNPISRQSGAKLARKAEDGTVGIARIK